MNTSRLTSIIISLMLAAPLTASAATFVITPSAGSYTVGDETTLSVSVDPEGSTVYTAMFDTHFSSDLFEVVSFSLNKSMLPLSMAGYDVVDNASGVLTKTGGYPGGIHTLTPFGTIVVRAIKSGEGALTVANTSKILDANGTNQEKTLAYADFTIVPANIPQKEVPPATTTTKATAHPAVTAATSSLEESTATSTTTMVAQLAAIAESTAFSQNAVWIFGLLIIMIVSVYSFVIVKRGKDSHRKKEEVE